MSSTSTSRSCATCSRSASRSSRWRCAGRQSGSRTRTRRRRAAQLDRFDAAAAQDDVRESMRAHTDFHFTLYDASQSPWLVALIRPAWDRSERFRPALLTSKDGPQERHRAYDQALLDACAAHDPEAAAAALHDHLELASVIFEHELGGRGIFDSLAGGVRAGSGRAHEPCRTGVEMKLRPCCAGAAAGACR